MIEIPPTIRKPFYGEMIKIIQKNTMEIKNNHDIETLFERILGHRRGISLTGYSQVLMRIMNIAILILELGGGGAERAATLLGDYYYDKGHRVYFFWEIQV